jgi:hypothetical protein
MHDGEIAGRDVADPLGLQDNRNTGGEVGLPNDQLPAAADLDDDALLGQLGLRP